MDNFYLLTFTPLGKFYFGSSHPLNESFYSKSLKYPTQTTLLGCIRRTILKQNNMLDDQLRYPKTGTNFTALTGSSPANGLGESNLDFGIIKKLSPVFITKFENDTLREILFPMPSDVYKKSEGLLSIVEYEDNSSAVSSRYGNSCYKKITSGKFFPFDVLGNRKMWEDYFKSQYIQYKTDYEMDKVLIPSHQVGISRENRNKLTGKFYRKKDFLMAENFAFGVIINTGDQEADILKNDIVLLGGEQSKFSLKIAKLEEKDNKLFPPGFEKFFNSYDPAANSFNVTSDKIVFLSNRIGQGTISNSKHSVINNMDTIRSLNSNGHITNSYRTIPAGSVFYLDTNFVITNDNKFATKIGYNFFI